jgi:hypothetical protein
MSEEESKIIIDEGWKAQIQREKELADQEPEAGDAEEEDQATEAPDMEPATFTSLVGSLATQIMYALGLVAPPDGEQVMVNLDAARYTLDILNVLVEKTEGNLSEEESEMLTQTSTELEQVFVMRVQQFQEQAMQQAGVDPNTPPQG